MLISRLLQTRLQEPRQLFNDNRQTTNIQRLRGPFENWQPLCRLSKQNPLAMASRGIESRFEHLSVNDENDPGDGVKKTGLKSKVNTGVDL